MNEHEKVHQSCSQDEEYLRHRLPPIRMGVTLKAASEFLEQTAPAAQDDFCTYIRCRRLPLPSFDEARKVEIAYSACWCDDTESCTE